MSSQSFNLAWREADSAIRPVSNPPEILAGRRVGRIQQAIYAAPELAQRLKTGQAFASADWIGASAVMGYRLLDDWMTKQGLDACCRYRTDSGLAMYAAIRDGSGAGVLPTYLGDPDPALVRIGDPIPALASDLWLLIHPDMSGTARIRAVTDVLANGLRERLE